MLRRTLLVLVAASTVAIAQQPGQPILIQGGRMGGMGMQPAYYPQTATYSTTDDSIKLAIGEVELRLADDTRLRAIPITDTLELTTTYGKLTIPLAKVLRVECGLRISDDEQKEIAAAIADLTSTDAKKRIAGRDALFGLKEKALPALKRAIALGATGEAGAALADAEARVKGALPNDRQAVSDRDRIEVEGSTFTGILSGETFKIKTMAFGEQNLKLAHLRTMRTAFKEPEDNIPVVPFPGSLNGYAGQFGKVLKFNVTAAAQGAVWGTGTYTLDTYLPAAAIHMGVLKPGDTGVVKIKIVQSPQQYVGTTQNGITSGQYPYYQAGGYEVIK